jgi:hypothetical protein
MGVPPQRKSLFGNDGTEMPDLGVNLSGAIGYFRHAGGFTGCLSELSIEADSNLSGLPAPQHVQNLVNRFAHFLDDYYRFK